MVENDLMSCIEELAPLFSEHGLNKIKLYYDREIDILHVDSSGSDDPDNIDIKDNGDIILKYKRNKLVGIIYKKYLAKVGSFLTLK